MTTWIRSLRRRRRERRLARLLETRVRAELADVALAAALLGDDGRDA